MKAKKIYSMCLIMTIVAAMGYTVENIWIGMTRGYINNRGMVLPFLLGYGIAILLIYLLWGIPSSPRIFAKSVQTGKWYWNTLFYFLAVCLCVGVGECLLGLFVEWITGIQWWNYNAIPLHITQYTSIPTTLAFSTMITVFMHFIFTPLLGAFMKINTRVLGIVACVLMGLMIVDFLLCALYMLFQHKTLLLWEFVFKDLQLITHF